MKNLFALLIIGAIGGIYEGVQDNVVMWRFPKLERDSILGPFNFRVKAQEGALLPDSVKATSEARDIALITGRQLSELSGINNTAAGFLENAISFEQLVQKR